MSRKNYLLKKTVKSEKKKLIAIRLSPDSLAMLNDFAEKFPGMSQGAIVEVGLYCLNNADEHQLKELFFDYIRGGKKRP